MWPWRHNLLCHHHHHHYQHRRHLVEKVLLRYLQNSVPAKLLMSLFVATWYISISALLYLWTKTCWLFGVTHIRRSFESICTTTARNNFEIVKTSLHVRKSKPTIFKGSELFFYLIVSWLRRFHDLYAHDVCLARVGQPGVERHQQRQRVVVAPLHALLYQGVHVPRVVEFCRKQQSHFIPGLMEAQELLVHVCEIY